MTRRMGRGSCRTLAILVGFAVVHLQIGAGRAAAQQTDDDLLGAASAGRTVRVRLGMNGAARVTDMPVEVYVARVLAGEGEPRAAAAAQQALAVAIRTFAASNAGRHRRDGFDLCDTTHCQVLRPVTPASRDAALATAGQLLTYDGRPAEVFYSASCGGRSEAVSEVWSGAVDLPYLRSADDEVHDGEEPWTLDVPIARVEGALRRAGFDGRRLKDVEVERRSESGRATRLRLSGLRPDEIAGEDFRAALGARELRSTRFTLTNERGVLRFTGRGYGHGVGLCVVGAGRRAARGETAAAILERYYPGLRLQPVASLSYAPVLEPVPEHVPQRAASPAEQLALRMRDELGAKLRIPQAPAVQVQIHETLDAFRRATSRPWWVSTSVDGSTIDLAPLAVLAERDGLEASVRRGVAEVLLGPALAGRPAWVRIGAARYYATPSVIPGQRAADYGRSKSKCPSDAELTMPVSATAHRLAELRAEACFARALEKAGDWRSVR